MSENRHRVCAVGDLPPGDRTIVSIDRRSVGVFNVDGEFFALENHCAHQHGPVCKGKVQPKLVGEFVEPGERVREFHGERPAISCPWHGWEYDLETGTHLGVTDIALETFDVFVEDGEVFVEASAEQERSD